MALSRPLQFSATCVATLFGLAFSGLQAAEGVVEKPYEYKDVRIGWTSAPSPSVYAETKGGGNGYNYNGTESRGSRFTVTYLSGKAPAESKVGTVVGAQFALGSYNLGDGGQSYRLVQPMVDVYYGWQYGIVDTPALRGWIEMLPFLGVGGSVVELDQKNRLGYAIEGGVRFGAYLTERAWQFGITSSAVIGTSVVKGDSNQLRLNTNGLTFGAEVGYRF